MSTQTLAPADDFERFEFAALVAGLGTQPFGESLPEPPPPLPADGVRSFRPSKAAVRREGQQQIAEALGLRRHRAREREA